MVAYSYSNTFGTGDRTGSITVTTNATLGGSSGPITRLVNGAKTANAAGGAWFNGGAGDAGKIVKFDFGVGQAPKIKQCRWFTDSSTPFAVLCQWAGSNDDMSYTNIGATHSCGGVAGSPGTMIDTELISNNTGYRYYRLTLGTTSSTPWIEEVEFYTDQGTTADQPDTSYYYPQGGQSETHNQVPNVTGNTGSARSSITVTMSPSPFAGTVDNLVDGNISNNSSDSIEFASGATNQEIKFDFGTSTRINAFFYVQSTSAAQGTYTFAGSNDDSSYTSLQTGIDLSNSSSNHEVTFTNTVAYRYYKLTQTGGTTTGGGVPWVQEFYFKCAPYVDNFIDFTASMSVGITEASTFTNQIEFSPSFSVGISMATAQEISKELDAISMLVGVMQATSVTYIHGNRQPVVVMIS